MNKKFLSLLVLGLVVSAPAFTAAAAGSDSDEENSRGISDELTRTFSKNKHVNWSRVLETAGLKQDPEDIDAATMRTGYSYREARSGLIFDKYDPNIDWSALAKAAGLEQSHEKIDAAKVITKETPNKTKSSQKASFAITVDTYYAPLEGEIAEITREIPETEETIKALEELSKKYGKVVGPLMTAKQNATKKKRFPQDSQNKLTAYQKAQKEIRELIQKLKQRAGSAAAKQRNNDRAAESARITKIESDKRDAETKQRKKEIEKKKREKADRLKRQAEPERGIDPFLASGISPEDHATMKKILDQAAKQGMDPETFQAELEEIMQDPIQAHNKYIPEKFCGDDQVRPHELEIDELFYLFVGHQDTADVHACPVCGEIKDAPCTIKYVQDPTYRERNAELIKEANTKLDEMIELAKSDKDKELRILIERRNPKVPEIYNLLLALIHKAQKDNENISMHELGKLFFQFRSLTGVRFEHVEVDKPTQVRAEERAAAGAIFDASPMHAALGKSPSLQIERMSLFLPTNKAYQIAQSSGGISQDKLLAFARKLKMFAEQISEADAAVIMESFTTDQKSVSDPILVNWCPACLECHPEQVKVQTHSTQIQDQGLQHKLYKELEKLAGPNITLYNLMCILAYTDWHHAK